MDLDGDRGWLLDKGRIVRDPVPGCVRLDEDNARAVFEYLQVGDGVHVF